MNKNDLLLIIPIFIISLFVIFLLKFSNNQAKNALIFYENEQVLKVPLNINKTYNVKGYNGDVLIEVNNNRIRVNQENSPHNLCSKQGYIDSSYETIVCLPNKIVVKIIDEEIIDTVVK